MFTAILIGLGKIGLLNDVDRPKNSPIETIANAFTSCPKCKLISAVDIDLNKQNIFERKYNLKAYSSIQEASKFHTPDIAIIATPTNSHASVFEEVVKNINPRIVLCEKPLAFNVTDSLKIIELSQKFNIPVLINYMRRTDSSLHRIKKLIETQKIIGPFKGVGWYTRGVFNNGSHLIDLFQFFFGDIKECKAIRKPINNYEFGDIDVDIFIKFENGAEPYLLASTENSYRNFGFTLHSKFGTLDYDNNKIIWANKSAINNPYLNPVQSFTLETESPKLYLNVANDVCNYLNNKVNYLPSLVSSFRIVQFLEALHE